MRGEPVLWPSLMLLAGALACVGSNPVPGADAAAQAREAAKAPTLTPERSGTTKRLQAISPVNPQVAWASGIGGAHAPTIDGGATPRTGGGPRPGTPGFRDVARNGAPTALLLPPRPGDQAPPFKTPDGGDP